MVDEAVSAYGRWVEGMLEQREEVKKGNKVIGHRAKYRLDVLLGIQKPPPLPTAREIRRVRAGK